MRIAVYNEKGGSGKTNLAVHLAILWPAAYVDLDEQKTGTLWLQNRKQPAAILEDIPPPGQRAVVDFAPGKDLSKAKDLNRVDAILVPVRPTFSDLRTLGNTVALIKATGKPAAFVVNGIILGSSETKEIGAALAPHGLPVLGIFSNRVAYGRAGLAGSTAGELGDMAAKVEVDSFVRKFEQWLNQN